MNKKHIKHIMSKVGILTNPMGSYNNKMKIIFSESLFLERGFPQSRSLNGKSTHI